MRLTRTFLALAVALALTGCGRVTGDMPAQENATADVQRELNAAAPQPRTTADPPAQPPETATDPVSACLIQDGSPVPENAIRAVGTEPFWATTVAGRCVTYSTPEDQQGTRIWTRFEGSAANGKWTGALDRQPFVMTTRSEAGCSDGMSDKRYPIAVTLTVRGEERRGCADNT